MVEICQNSKPIITYVVIMEVFEAVLDFQNLISRKI